MRGDVKVGVLGAAAAIMLAAGSTVAMAAASGRFAGAQPQRCTAPALSGTVIDVTLADMGGHMGDGRGGMMGNGSGPMMGPGRWGTAGMMIVRVSPTSATAGTASLRVTNVGAMTHELVVLPLEAGGRPGQRAVATDGTVDETGSLGEASNTCGADHGDGILPGGVGWTTLHLASGRYELLCNLPGHYASGMYVELDITTD